MGEEIESQSAICIRILQVHQWKGKRRRRTRHEVRNEIVGILNHMQQLCWPKNDSYTAADVDFVGFTNDQGMMEGMISISKRNETLFEDDCLVGAILAFFIGHRVREKRVGFSMVSGKVRTWRVVARHHRYHCCQLLQRAVAPTSSVWNTTARKGNMGCQQWQGWNV